MSGPADADAVAAPASAGPRRPRLILAFALAGLGLLASVVAVIDTTITWRAFHSWQPGEFTVSRWLSATLFGMVRDALPKHLLRIEGYLQALAILGWTGLAALGALAAWWARRKCPPGSRPRPRRALGRLLAALLVCLPATALSSYISWQCIFVSPKEVFEKRLARQVAREGREPTPDEEVRAAELGAQYDEWRRESILRLFMRFEPRP